MKRVHQPTDIDGEPVSGEARDRVESATGQHPLAAPSRLSRDGLQRLQQAAALRGGVCLSEAYGGRDLVYAFRCARGHEWQTKGRQVLSGKWCLPCAHLEVSERNRLADGLERLQQSAAAHGGVCLSTAYEKQWAHYAFRCAEGHEWLSPAVLVWRGHWCGACASVDRGARRRLPDGLERLRAAALAKGGVCLAEAYTVGAARYRMRCAEGHEWEASGHSLLRGSWCGRCAQDALRLSIEDARAVARHRGGQCLSEVYLRTTDHLIWLCHAGHQWPASLAGVQQGKWCPECANAAKISRANSKARMRYRDSRRHDEDLP